MSLLCRYIFAVFLLAILAAPSTWAAGLWLYEAGTPNMGTASAGRGAIAQDASVAGVNPAGMTKLNRSQLMVSVVGLFGDSKFKVDAATFGGGDAKNKQDTTTAGSINYVYSATSNLKLGITALSFFGAGSEYNDD